MFFAAHFRLSHESLVPALIGVGLLHVLAAILVWSLLPRTFLEPNRLNADESTKLVWRTPSDFLMAVPLTPSRNQADNPVKHSSPPVLQRPKTKSPIASKGSKSKPRPAPKMTESASDMETRFGDFSPPPVVSERTPALPPGGQAGQGKPANKYITLSSVSDEQERSAAAQSGKSVLSQALPNEIKSAAPDTHAGADMAAVENALQQAILRAWQAPPVQSVPVSQRRAMVEISVMRDGTIQDAVLKSPSGSRILDASVSAAAGRVMKIPETLPSSFRKERYVLRVNFQIE
jgi:TonB family protein